MYLAKILSSKGRMGEALKNVAVKKKRETRHTKPPNLGSKNTKLKRDGYGGMLGSVGECEGVWGNAGECGGGGRAWGSVGESH